MLGPGLPSAAADSLLVSLFDRDNYAGEVHWVRVRVRLLTLTLTPNPNPTLTHDGNPWDQTLEA